MEFKDNCVDVRNVIAQDPIALMEWNTVKDSLVTSEVHRFRISQLFKNNEYQEAILQTIQWWCSNQLNPNWEQFIQIMRNNELSKLAGKLENMNLHVHLARRTSSTCFEVNAIPHNFTGRKIDMEVLDKLMKMSRNKDPGFGQFVAVTGLGGIGKSTLCTKYAYDNSQTFQNVLWMNAETSDSLRSSFHRLGIRLGIVSSQSQNILIKDLIEAVQEYFSNKSCLFIFDNLKDLVALEPFRSTWSFQPFVLITSRTLNIVPVNLHLATLTEDEASSFVLAEVKNSIQSDVKELVQLLECLPLTLQQAVAYIRERFGEFGAQTPIQRYIAQFKTSAQLLLNDEQFRQLNGYEKTTYKTWTVTVDHIRTKSAAAVELLDILSFLNPDLISVVFMKRFMEEDLLEQSLMVLKKYSMISLDSGIVRIHRMVQQVLMLCLGEGRRTQLASDIVELIGYELKDVNFTDIVRESVSHGLQLIKHQHMNSMSSKYLSDVCWYLSCYGNDNDSLKICSSAIQHFAMIFGSNHIHTLRMKFRMGRCCYMSGNKSAALAIFKYTQKQAIANAEVGRDHSLTLEIRLGIAQAYLTTNTKKSLKMYEKLIPIIEKTFGKEHRNVVVAISFKALAMINLDMLDEALATFKIVQEMSVCGDAACNIDGLSIKRDIAWILFRKEMFEQALVISREVVQGWSSVFGESNADTVFFQNLITQIETKLEKGQKVKVKPKPS